MTPQPDAWIAAQDAAPPLFGAALRVLAGLALLVAASWALLRWRRRVEQTERRLAVVDRASLSRGASVALLRVDGRHLLVGVAADGVRLLRDLGPSAPAPTFRRTLAEARGDEDTLDARAAR
jgi:flagellar protein FliO/FliZ